MKGEGRNVPEPTRLDKRKLDVPLRLDLVADGLGESLDCPLAGTVQAEERHASLSTNARDLLNQSALRFLLVAHHFHSRTCHVDEPEEIDLHLLSDLLLRVLLETASEAVAGVLKGKSMISKGSCGGV